MNKTPDLTFNILELEHEQYGRGSKRFNQDEARLARFGKRQQLQARLSAKITFQQGWANGGAGTLLYGFVIVWIGNMFQTAVMAEISSIPSMYSFIGVDAASHIAEEIQDASSTIPKSMWISTLLNGALGLAMIIALLFCMGDPNQALNGPNDYPLIDIWAYMVGSNNGATAMAVVITAMFSFGCIGILATASRMTWAFARENGLPGSTYISRIEPRTSLPIWSILQSTVSSLALALISLGSSVALEDLFSLVIVGFYSTFILSASVMLHKRLTTPDAELDWGKYRLGRAGVPVTIAALVYSIAGMFFCLWPSSPNPDAKEMNWTSVVFVGALLVSLAFWFAHGRKVYRGPVMEI
ncbi:MAG: hypothetical protein LQ340_004583 [Diploschistes diacapsis]|nr:MAG: hypothetical protein LQ340_004583 [Diploschistes diacapsis]